MRWTEALLNRELDDRYFCVGIHEKKRHLSAVVKPTSPVDGTSKARGSKKVSDALGDFDRTRCRIADLVEFARKSAEVVDRIVGRDGVHGRRIGLPMSRDHENRGRTPRQQPWQLLQE